MNPWPDISMEHSKTSLMARGLLQERYIHNDDIFAPKTKMNDGPWLLLANSIIYSTRCQKFISSPKSCSKVQHADSGFTGFLHPVCCIRHKICSLHVEQGLNFQYQKQCRVMVFSINIGNIANSIWLISCLVLQTRHDLPVMYVGFRQHLKLWSSTLYLVPTIALGSMMSALLRRLTTHIL